MFVFINGRIVPEEQAVVSVFDRGFLYGDGLFETMAVHAGVPFRWEQHLERLRQGAEFLKLQLPHAPVELRRFADELLVANKAVDGLLRLTLSRGVGVRGYSPAGADRPSLVITLHPVPAPSTTAQPLWQLVTASFRLPAQERLSQFKTCNKLPQILARAEAEAADGDEALLLNTDGFVVEASSSNLFWIDRGTVCTPPLGSGILAGVTRAIVEELCGNLRLPVRETNITREALVQMEGVFLSLSSVGIAEGVALDRHDLHRSPVTRQIYDAYSALLQAETQSKARIEI